MDTPPTPFSLAQARNIIAHPSAETTDQQRLLAWAVAKTARGQTFHQPRIYRDQLARRRADRTLIGTTRHMLAQSRAISATSWPDDAA